MNIDDGVFFKTTVQSLQILDNCLIGTDETYNYIIDEIRKINLNDLSHNKTNDKYINLVENIKKFNESVRHLSIPSSTMGFEKNVMNEYKRIHIDIGKEILETYSNLISILNSDTKNIYQN